MKPAARPSVAAPGGLRGSTRMFDPTEAEHDRVRRRAMNGAFLLLLLVNLGHAHWIGLYGWDWLTVLLLIIATVPLGLAVKVFELRFKMAGDERARALAELPARRKAALVAYAILVTGTFLLNAPLLTWALIGAWGYDFVTYYHDRPERLRHLYAVMKILEELPGVATAVGVAGTGVGVVSVALTNVMPSGFPPRSDSG